MPVYSIGVENLVDSWSLAIAFVRFGCEIEEYIYIEDRESLYYN